MDARLCPAVTHTRTRASNFPTPCVNRSDPREHLKTREAQQGELGDLTWREATYVGRILSNRKENNCGP